MKIVLLPEDSNGFHEEDMSLARDVYAQCCGILVEETAAHLAIVKRTVNGGNDEFLVICPAEIGRPSKRTMQEELRKWNEWWEGGEPLSFVRWKKV